MFAPQLDHAELTLATLPWQRGQRCLNSANDPEVLGRNASAGNEMAYQHGKYDNMMEHEAMANYAMATSARPPTAIESVGVTSGEKY